MTVDVAASARADLIKIVDYYEQQRPGLGAEFTIQFNEVLERISRYPHGWTQVSRRSRRCLFHDFDYGAFYQIRDDVAVVFAVWHLKRRAGWKARERF
jgi:plasmid stabilization system protein ParE